MNGVGNECRLSMMGDLNTWVKDRMRVGITTMFGLLGENDNGKRVIDFSTERGLCVGNTYFKHKCLFKCTRVARGQDQVEIMSVIDLDAGKER